ncbi:MAG: hypothetical protein ABW167_20580 [Baekduia sp.]
MTKHGRRVPLLPEAESYLAIFDAYLAGDRERRDGQLVHELKMVALDELREAARKRNAREHVGPLFQAPRVRNCDPAE